MAFNGILVHMLENAEEEERRRRNALLMRTLRNNVDPFDVMSEDQFITIFRLSKDAVIYLCDVLQEPLNRIRASGLIVQTQVLAALRFFAIGSYQKGIGNDYAIAISQPSISRAIRNVAKALIERLADEWIKFPTTEVERSLKRRFQEERNFKGVIGCIDCTHVAIIQPSVHEELYANHKGFHSLNVQAAATHDLKILNVNARFPGTTHDNFIWKQSAVRNEMIRLYNNEDRATWLLGDSGYGLEPWLMTPITNAAEGSAKQRYTQCHTSTRNCVERMFGKLKNVWRCLLGHRVLHYDPVTAARITIACSILHNIRLRYNLMDREVDIDEEGEAAALQRIANQQQRLIDPQLQGDEVQLIGDRLVEARRIQRMIIRTQFT